MTSSSKHSGAPRWVRLTRAAAVAVASLGVGALVGSNVWVHASAAGRVFTVDEYLARAPEPRPVALVLGAEAFDSGRPSPVLAARLDVGEQLLRAGLVDKLVLTGAGGAVGNNETEAMHAYLVRRGVDPARLETDPVGVNTHASVRNARKVGYRDVVVVSQTFHLPRTVALAEVAGLDAVGVGDITAHRWQGEWRRSQVREVFAGLKAAAQSLLDVAGSTH